MRYVLKRLGLMLPTLFVILCINFIIVQMAPGGPVEYQLTKIQNEQQALAAQGFALANINYQGASGLSPQMLAELNARFGYDLPLIERFWLMMSNFARFDLGESFFQGRAVIELIIEKMPITLLLGVLSLIVMYGFGIVIGLYKVRHHRSLRDSVLTAVLAVLHALPVFMLGVLLLVLLAGSSGWQIFPIQGVVSPNFEQLGWIGKIKDLLWHLSLPVLAGSLGSIAGIAYLTKFSVMTELDKSYVQAMQARGLTRTQIIYTQVLKNALLPVMSHLPMAVVGVLFSGNFLIEIIFGIDGIGRLGYEAVMQRDYPLMFGILYIFTLIAMVVQLIFDVLYRMIDPRVDFEAV